MLNLVELWISETRISDHTWPVGSEVTDRSVLSDELANFCAKYAIYNVKKMEDRTEQNRTLFHVALHLAIILQYSTTRVHSHLFPGGTAFSVWSAMTSAAFNKIKNYNQENTIVGVIMRMCLSLMFSKHA